MKTFFVRHNFQAEEDVELSVKKGELLEASEGIERDGWIMVQRVNNREERGFVPISYLSEKFISRASLSTTSLENPSEEAKKNDRGAHSADAHHLVECSVTASSTADLGAAVEESAVGSALRMGEANSFDEGGLVTRNEIEYAKLRRQREESNAYLLKRLTELAEGMQVCHKETASVTQALMEMEKNIQKDHSQWKQLIEEERSRITAKGEN